MSNMQLINEEGLRQAREGALNQALRDLLSQIPDAAVKAAIAGEPVFRLKLGMGIRKIDNEDPEFIKFKDAFLRHNSAISTIKLKPYYAPSLKSFDLWVEFYFKSPEREKTPEPTKTLEPHNRKGWISRLFSLAWRSNHQATQDPLAIAAPENPYIQRVQALSKTLKAQAESFNTPKLRTKLDAVTLNIEKTAQLALNNPSAQSGLGTYLNIVENLTRAIDAFLKIPEPSSENTAKLISSFDCVNSETASFQANIQSMIQRRTELEFDTIATVMKLRAPSRN